MPYYRRYYLSSALFLLRRRNLTSKPIGMFIIVEISSRLVIFLFISHVKLAIRQVRKCRVAIFTPTQKKPAIPSRERSGARQQLAE